MLKYLLVGVGGFVGAVARLWVGDFIGARVGARFPYGTFFINISGSFLIGFVLAVFTAKAHLSLNWHYLIPVGFIGAYTTFSTFEFEILSSIQDGQFVIASLNIALSVLLGFVAVWLGAVAGKAIP